VLSLRSRDGTALKVRMTGKTTVATARALQLADLPKNAFVGVTAVKGPDGVLVARSELSEPVRARAENLAQGAWPTVARKIGIVAPRLDGRADIFLGEPTAMIRRAKPHFFDFEELQRRIRPEQVEFISRPKPPETNPDGAKPRVESP
jgi:hypothetical protein